MGKRKLKSYNCYQHRQSRRERVNLRPAPGCERENLSERDARKGAEKLLSLFTVWVKE